MRYAMKKYSLFLIIYLARVWQFVPETGDAPC